METSPGARFCANCGFSLVEQEVSPDRAQEEKKVVSVLFADLAGFTARTERSDPEDVRARLTIYHKTAREHVEANGGKVEKLMGDGVFAVFGVPAAHEDDPERAIRAALGLQDAIDVLNEDHPDLGLVVRASVTTGEAIVQLDSKAKDRETIVGDVVNTASRLEAVAPEGGVVVDERTYLATRNAIYFDDLDPVDLKGKSGSTALWLATGARARQGVAVTERHQGPFVGRQAELAVLIDSLHRTLATETVQLVTIIGEPGSGKSRLLHEFKRELDTRPETLWWKQGRCLPYGEGITFWALGEIVKAQAGILETDTDHDADSKLRHAVNHVIADDTQAEWVRLRLAPLTGASVEERPVEQGELFSAWLRFFAAMAERHPLILVVEDIHWADEALLDFLRYLAEWAVDVPVLLISAARPELLSHRPDWGAGIRNASTISLTPLDNDDAAVLLAALLNRAVLPADSQQLILERAGGNPLYVTEFVRLAEEAGLIDEVGRISDLGLPDTVQALIAARLDLLSPGEKELLQAAAVVGKVFWSGALAALRPAAHSSEALRELMRRELIKPIREASMQGQEEYAFVHALVRDVAYSQLARPDRAYLHQATAAWIEAVSGERVIDVAELLAYHLGEAVDLTPDPGSPLRERAYRALMQAGGRARELDARQGVSYYRRALAAAEKPGDRADALIWIGRLFQEDIDAACDALEEARELFAEAGDPEGEARALIELTNWRWWRGDSEGAFELTLQAVGLLEHRPASQAKAQALVANVDYLSLRGLDDDAVTLANEVAPLVDAHGTPQGRIRLLARRGLSMGGEQGMADMREALRQADEGNYSLEMITIRNNLATILVQWGSPTEALPIIDEALQLGEERGLPASAEWAAFTKTEILIWAGEWDAAIQMAADTIRADDERGGSQVGEGARANRDVMLFYRGEDVRESWASRIEFGREVKDQQVLAPVLAIGATVWWAAGDSSRALALADEFADSATGHVRDVFLPFVTHPLAAMGETDRIARMLETASGSGSQALLGRKRAEGHLAVSRGDLATAAMLFDEAVAVCDEYDREYEGVIARIDLATALDEADPRFAEVVAAARMGAERLGALRLLDQLDDIEGIATDEAVRA